MRKRLRYQKKSSFLSDRLASDIKNQEIAKAAEQIQHDPQFDPQPGLRAAAIEASLKNQPEKAYKLWETLSELDSSDAYALFNAGYWALKFAEASKSIEAIKWAQQASERFEQAIKIRPDFYEAVINEGVALDIQATRFSNSDFLKARSLWGLAREKYQQALIIKPDSYEAANNLGNTFSREAKELAKSNLSSARNLWLEASKKYKLALNIKPDFHEAVNNWGSALSQEAQELVNSDLEAARKLWKEANEKFQQALSINSDFSDAIANWGGSLMNEANAFETTDSVKARELRNRAEQLLLPLAQSAPNLVAYNMACVHARRGDVTSCLNWLKTAQVHNTLESCEHLQTDADLDAVWDHPDFQAWLQSVCSN